MKKSVFTLFLIALAMIANANPVSVEVARKVGAKFVSANSHRSSDLKLVSTYRVENGVAAFYLFNTDSGFVIVSADDCAIPILGYSDEGPLDVNDIPEQMDVYLQGFVEQIQYGIENRLPADAEVVRQWELVQLDGRIYENRNANEVGPLLDDTWNQGCYYNLLCPEDVDGPCGHTLTGCTGTAMGQIIRYWGYPETGYGSTTYTPPGYPQQSVNFSQTTYDYANMARDLRESSSDDEKIAVATLLWHCGVALHASYGTGGTSAYPSDVRGALNNYFHFSNEMIDRYKEDADSWLVMVKESLDQGWPLHYSAWTPDGGGHSFVCDGYNANDQLHIYWGWSGSGNGYFPVEAFNVNGSSFTVNHYAIFNIHPRIDATITTSANPSTGGYAMGGGLYEQGQYCSVHASANNGFAFVNWTENGAQVSNNADYSFMVMGDRNLVANFEPLPTYTITANANPSNGGTASGGGSFQQGQTCTVHASANLGYTFVNWTENGDQVYNNYTYSFTVNGNRNLVANFSQNNYTITASANPSNGGTTTGGGVFHYGESCSLTASSAIGFHFVNWTEGNQVVSEDSTFTFTVTGNRAIVAQFEYTDYEISASCNLENGGLITGTGTYHYGDEVTLNVEPNTYFFFESWTEDGDTLSYEPQISFIVEGNRALVANLYYFDAVNDYANDVLNVYPNPADDIINVDGEVFEVKIYNALGQLLVSRRNNGQRLMQIDISQLGSGIFTLKMSTADGWIERQIVKR